MGAIDNSNIQNLARNYVPVGFVPAVAYVYDATAKTVKFTDSSVIPSPDTLKIVHCRVLDADGNEVRGEITATGSGGAQTVSVASLNLAKPLNLTVTVTTTNHITGDGSAYHIGAAGNLANWDNKQNA